MKKFKDLVFKQHPNGRGIQAVSIFDNGYGVSVVRFSIFGSYASYTDDENEFELAIVEGDEKSFSLCYDSGITENVIGHLTRYEVSSVMLQVQNLKR